ncbi:hypothetical protein SBA4_6460008 [Candidatus Sulfopaludibacter sp. SbA4]|nr:hypothetical protein SBA4_6460008 [Candidatus Sulfopaludibacter sp. SbA4]
MDSPLPHRLQTRPGSGYPSGEVYRATDTRLNGEVAIKVLPASFAQDPERMARFQREAQVLASLNHPNIAQIYSVEERALVECDRFCCRLDPPPLAGHRFRTNIFNLATLLISNHLPPNHRPRKYRKTRIRHVHHPPAVSASL